MKIKTKFSITILLNFFWILLVAQSHDYEIVIQPEVLKSLEKGIIILSDSEGNVLMDEEFEHHQLSGQRVFTYKTLDDVSINLTLFLSFALSRYEYDHANTCIYTLLNIGPKTNILPNEFIKSFQSFETEYYKVKINGVENIEKFEVLSIPDFGKKYKGSLGAGVKLNFNHNSDEDFFALLKNEDNTPYKYVYIPFDRLRKKLEINWEELTDELEAIKLDFPKDREGQFTLRIDNAVTGKPCARFCNCEEPLKPFNILLPTVEYIFQFDFKYKTLFKNTDSTHNYLYIQSYDFEIPDVFQSSEEEFEFKIWSFDEKGFELATRNSNHQLEVHLLSNSQKIFRNVENYNFDWMVSGSPSGNFIFNFPIFEANYTDFNRKLIGGELASIKAVYTYKNESETLKKGIITEFISPKLKYQKRTFLPPIGY
jgi:hypothetical protein